MDDQLCKAPALEVQDQCLWPLRCIWLTNFQMKYQLHDLVSTNLSGRFLEDPWRVVGVRLDVEGDWRYKIQSCKSNYVWHDWLHDERMRKIDLIEL